MALKFDTHEAIRKLRGKDRTEAQAEGVVEFVRDATAEVVTTEYLDARLEATEAKIAASEARLGGELRAEMYRVALIQSAVIVGALGVIVTLIEVL